MPSLHVQKIVGTGNDFLFIDGRQPLTGASARLPRAELVRRLCDRHLGIGADGLVFMESIRSPNRFKWDFYNTDGSPAEMCGNASRCAGRWAERNLGLTAIELETVPGLVRVEIKGDAIVSRLDYLRISFETIDFEARGLRRSAVLVNTGVPHVVLEVARIEDAASMREEIRLLRFHPQAGARGANVTFLQKTPGGGTTTRFATTTFERGVENFTLSCGTGVLAAGAVGLRSSASRAAELTTPGGRLAVSFGESWSGATLEGPARIVFAGEVEEEILR